jgi:hypothetical protein
LRTYVDAGDELVGAELVVAAVGGPAH